jgi:Spy/CpxP family protein refolding chaperone
LQLAGKFKPQETISGIMIVAVADASESIFIRMKFSKIILLAFYIFFGCGFVAGQENTNTPERTPEQEAARQTEKMQQELNLTPEQVQQVHEINLKYARERQVSNSRTEALQRVKNKEQDLRKVLKPAQYNELQNKQYERSTPNPAIRRTTPANNNSYRDQNSQPTYRTGPRVRQPNNENGAVRQRPNTGEQRVQPGQRSTNDENRRTTTPATERNSGVRSTTPYNPPSRQTTPSSSPGRRTDSYTPSSSRGSDNNRSSERSGGQSSGSQPGRSGSSNSGRR